MISKDETGADKISLIVPVNLGKNIANEALEVLWTITVNIINPGTIKDPYDTILIASILDPIAEPKTTKYNIVVITGDKNDWNIVDFIRIMWFLLKLDDFHENS